MPTILTAAGKGAELTPTEADSLFYREVNPQSGNYTVDTGDNLATVEYTGTGGHTITLPDASTLLAAEDTSAFMVRIKHGGTGTLTVARDTGDTIDGEAANITLIENGCVTLKCGSVTDDWMIISRYSELSGTWTPTLIGSSTAGTQTYSTQTGTYITVGNMVLAQFNVTITAKDASMAGNARIGGLPFTAEGGATNVASACFGYISGINLAAAGRTQILGGVTGGTDYVALLDWADGGASNNVAVSEIAAATTIIGSVVYQRA